MDQTKGYLWNLGTNICYPYRYYLNKPKPTKSILVNPRTDNSTGLDLRVPQTRVSVEKDRRSAGITRKLASGLIIDVQVWWKVHICNSYLPGASMFTCMR